ncbi:capsule assembly Wzi family protein [Acidipila rosea]|uniref:Capsule assembly protein Wzi n=1 Tax=Acidipila rosea TaxID=768535 RepID=A0A4R1L9C9_9BACT|nr:capsule assembly Wzi family protein [Acidipila rosea]TCK73583.1 capsule assembly protein Wzi [Acidipila rosea]
MKPLPSLCAVLAVGIALQPALAEPASPNTAAPAQQTISPNYKPVPPVTYTSTLGSTYVPIDSWIYPALDRLQALGYLDTAFLGIRPWTRLSIVHMLEQTSNSIDEGADTSGNQEARSIYLAVRKELQPDIEGPTGAHDIHVEFESAYTRALGISGTPLHDSFHLGQSIINDYGRPYEQGFNNVTGASARAEAGRFTLYFRGEYQHAPSAAGYNPLLVSELSALDYVPLASNPNQATIPGGPIASANYFRILEANLSYHLLGHEISFGKSDHWMGPDQGGSFAWSNNAQNIYAFQIDRVEPLHVPLLSDLLGPFRYDFFVGSLKGHTDPNAPWEHTEKINFKPTKNLEMGFERTVIWGGKDHVPITLHSFLKSFFSFQNVSGAEKFSRNDPGARFSTFDFSYRLPFLRNWLTLYTDSLAHDDVTPVSAPRRAGIAPGIYLSHVPGVPKLDFRVEAASTDPDHVRSQRGAFLYAEGVQLQGYTNAGNIFGHWIGRESKGGQAWLTYHLSPDEQFQFQYRNAKAAKDFIAGGTTQNDFQFNVIKRVMTDYEVRGWVQYERWKAPIYKPGAQSDTSIAVQLTWFPKDKRKDF